MKLRRSRSVDIVALLAGAKFTADGDGRPPALPRRGLEVGQDGAERDRVLFLGAAKVHRQKKRPALAQPQINVRDGVSDMASAGAHDEVRPRSMNYGDETMRGLAIPKRVDRRCARRRGFGIVVRTGETTGASALG
jgi:hypothetical protein